MGLGFASTWKQRQARELEQRLSENRVFSPVVDLHLYQKQRFQAADGFVHPSSLDWKSRPETQIKKLLEKRRHDAPLLKRFRLGDIIHEDIQSLLTECFFDSTIVERHLESKKLLFRGTPDLIGKHKVLGNVLVEFKSISRYQKDRKSGDKWFNKIWKTFEQVGETDCYTDTDWAEIYERLCTAELKPDAPKSEHLTQSFTYAWVLGLFGFKIDYVCVCYVWKETYYLGEFWYNVFDNQDLIEKAKTNYLSVMRGLRKEWLRLGNAY